VEEDWAANVIGLLRKHAEPSISSATHRSHMIIIIMHTSNIIVSQSSINIFTHEKYLHGYLQSKCIWFWHKLICWETFFLIYSVRYNI
jgi:hypothetical protein